MSSQKRIIAVDGRWLSSGIGRYTLGFLDGLRMHARDLEIRMITMSKHVPRVRELCDSVSIVNAPIYTISEQFKIPLAARGADLLHVPHYNAPVFYCGRLVASILDLVHITDPTYRKKLSSRGYALPMMKTAALKARHIITLSEFSKKEIVQHLGVAEDKITPIYCGVSSNFSALDHASSLAEVSAALGTSGPYILYVGNLKPHKNVSTLLDAFSMLRMNASMECSLLIIGDDPLGKKELQLKIERLGLGSSIRLLARVSEEMLPKVYAAAEITVLPSFQEGFGLPIVESMACGVPVVCSQAASMPEVGGDAAVYFDPHSADHLAQVLTQVLSSSELRAHMRAEGFKQAKRFTWDNCGRGHAEVYRKVLLD